MAIATVMLAGLQQADAATAYAGARQELRNFTATLGPLGQTQTSSQTEATGHVNGVGPINVDPEDAAHAYHGPAGTAPSENDFTFKDMEDASYGRGDVLLDIGGNGTMNTDSLGESFVSGAATGGGVGRWDVEIDFTFNTPLNVVTLEADYDWALAIAGTGEVPSFASAQVSVEAILFDADTDEVVHSFDIFASQLSSALTRQDGEFNMSNSDSGTALEASIQLLPGDYRLSVVGTATSATHLIPEPTSGLLVGTAMAGMLIRRRRPATSPC